MAASYPGAVKSFTAIVNGVTKLVAALFNSPYDEITAIETELGADVAGSASDLKTRLAVSINDDGTLNPVLGAWVDKSASYAAQQAATDGFVVVTGTPDSTERADGYTDVNADPTTLRGTIYVTYTNGGGSFTMPVKKSDYWKVVVTGTIADLTVYWISLASA